MTIRFNVKDGIRDPMPNRLDGKIGIELASGRYRVKSSVILAVLVDFPNTI